MGWRSQEGERQGLTGGQPRLPGAPSPYGACTAPERNAVQGLPGSGKIWVLGGAKNTVWQPLPPRAGTLPLPSRPPTRETSSLSAPAPAGAVPRSTPVPALMLAGPPRSCLPMPGSWLSSQVPSPCLPWPCPHPWFPRAPRKGASSEPPTVPHCSEHCGPMPGASLRPARPLSVAQFLHPSSRT